MKIETLLFREDEMKRKLFVITMLLLISSLMFGCTSMMRGDFNMSLKKYPEAIPLYEEYLAGNAGSVEGMNKLGLAYLFTGRFDEAVTQFDNVLKKLPNNTFARLRLGQAYVNTGEIRKAADIWGGYQSTFQREIRVEVNKLHTFLRIIENRTSGEGVTGEEKEILTDYGLNVDQLPRIQLSDIANIVNYAVKNAVSRQQLIDCAG